MTDCGMRKASRSTCWSIKSVFGLGIALMLLMLGVASAPSSASAQASNAAVISLGPILTPFGTPASNAPVRVCPLTAIGNPCPTTGVSLYSNYNLTAPTLPNPTTLNSQGILNVFTAAGSYLVQVTPVATQPQNVYTFYVIASSGGGGGGGALALILEDSVTSIIYSVHVVSGALVVTNLGSTGTPSAINGLIDGSNIYSLTMTSGALTIVPESTGYPSEAQIPLTDTVTGATYKLIVSSGALTISVS